MNKKITIIFISRFLKLFVFVEDFGLKSYAADKEKLIILVTAIKLRFTIMPQILRILRRFWTDIARSRYRKPIYFVCGSSVAI